MIEFFKFPPNFGMRDASPFVLKLETYLRLAGLDYETTILSDPRKAPKGKLPFIRDNGQTIADSSIIIDYLKQTYGDPLGEGLNPEQKAVGHAVKTMLEERTYWVLVHTRWMEPKYQPITLNAWFGNLPFPIRPLIMKKVIRDMRKGMYAHGISRHSPEQIYAFGLRDIQAFEDVLADKPFLLGERVSEYDATGYGFLANFMAEPFPSPISDYIASSKTLLDYIERVAAKAFA